MKPERVPLIEGGILRAFLSSRDTAAQTELAANGFGARARLGERSDGAHDQHRARAARRHAGSIVADTKDGVYVAGMRSWSIDDHRLNFQFGPQIGYEIKNGKRGRIFKQPTYTGVTPHFWGSMDRVGGPGGLRRLGHAELRQGRTRADRPHDARLQRRAFPRRHGRGEDRCVIRTARSRSPSSVLKAAARRRSGAGHA